MSPVRLLLAEIGYRKINFALSVLAVAAATTLLVAGPVLVDGYGRETAARVARLEEETTGLLADLDDKTRKQMRDLGFNLLIVHRDTDMADFWAQDFTTVDMPQSYVDDLAKDPSLTLVTHLVATIQRKVKWNDRNVLLVGYLPETTQWHRERKAPMGYRVEPGTVLLGFELAAGIEEGDTIEVLGEPFTVARILPETGSKEDITLALRLEDAQRLLDAEGRITQIVALECHCAGERLPKIRAQLAGVLPETKVVEFRTKAIARAEQRDLVKEQRTAIVAGMARERGETQQLLERLSSVVGPLAVLLAAVWVGLLALANVRERRQEIGLLRALGKGTTGIAALVLGRNAIVGFLGAAIGFALGAAAARLLGTQTGLDVAAGQFRPAWNLLAFCLVVAPLLSVVAAYLPTLLAVTLDPAAVLRDR